ncbi:M28 family metallopeptidase [Rubrolithibacter danxiaensis]|uniref:M28 family metallopeptidase n=1 Tax=Rubrolithibacter danxiaensis TaxID=3390805 RepID=UPI003BF7FF74
MNLRPLLCILLFAQSSFAQDIHYSKKLIDTLTSSSFWGRGYIKNGSEKAAGFIESEFKSIGLQPLNGKNYFQPFTFPVNTFPGKMNVFLNGKRLVPGKDFIVSPESRGITGSINLTAKDSAHFINQEKKVLVSLEDKLTASVAQMQSEYTHILLKKESIKEQPSRARLAIDAHFIDKFKAVNICGILKGTSQPDSVIIISAHYDHLGGMGAKTFFPGANDNASGTALLLNLAKYYAANPPKYSIAFICFAGEELGLLGSEYFTVHPLIELSKIKFLINLDLVGTGNEGITVVNAKQFPKEFSILNEENDRYKLINHINARGKAANSDHYWFCEKGVPSFFIYTLGGIKAYHDIFDRSSTLPLTEYTDLFTLIVKFNQRLMNN